MADAVAAALDVRLHPASAFCPDRCPVLREVPRRHMPALPGSPAGACLTPSVRGHARHDLTAVGQLNLETDDRRLAAQQWLDERLIDSRPVGYRRRRHRSRSICGRRIEIRRRATDADFEATATRPVAFTSTSPAEPTGGARAAAFSPTR